MNKIHYFIDIIGQSVAPNRRVVEKPKEVLTIDLCLLIFFPIDCTKFDVIFVSALRNSRDPTSLEPHVSLSHETSKTFLEA